MPKIRKKTSKRTGLWERAKIKKKAQETRRKRNRDARRDPTWRNNKKRKADPGIPNSLPFKEEVLAEMEEHRRKAIEAKQALKEAKAAGKDVEVSESGSENEENEEDDEDEDEDEGSDDESVPDLVDSSISVDAPQNLGASLSEADVILQVLDARDPHGFRVESIEKLKSNKKVVLILNKVDLVPKETVNGWYNYLKSSFAVIPFACKSHIRQIEGFENGVKSSIGLSSLKSLLLGYKKDKKGNDPLKIVITGLPNVGKSSILNTIIENPKNYFKTASISTNSLVGAKNPTTTTLTIGAAKINLDEDENSSVILIDTPGLTFIGEPSDRPAELLRRNLGRADKVKEPEPLAKWIMKRANEEDLMLYFKLPAFASGDFDGFLKALANVSGRIKKRGVVDLVGATRHLIQSYVKSDLPYYTLAPPSDEVNKKDNKGSKKRKSINTLPNNVNSSIENDIESLPDRKSLRKARGEVRFVAAPSDSSTETREYVAEIGSAIDDDDDDEEDEEDEEDQEELGEDMEDENLTPSVEKEVPSPPPTFSKKRKERAQPSVKFSKEVSTKPSPKGNGEPTKTILKKGEKTKPNGNKKTKVETQNEVKDNGNKARMGLKGKKLESVEGEAFDFNEFF